MLIAQQRQAGQHTAPAALCGFLLRYLSGLKLPSVGFTGGSGGHGPRAAVLKEVKAGRIHLFRVLFGFLLILSVHSCIVATASAFDFCAQKLDSLLPGDTNLWTSQEQAAYIASRLAIQSASAAIAVDSDQDDLETQPALLDLDLVLVTQRDSHTPCRTFDEMGDMLDGDAGKSPKKYKTGAPVSVEDMFQTMMSQQQNMLTQFGSLRLDVSNEIKHVSTKIDAQGAQIGSLLDRVSALENGRASSSGAGAVPGPGPVPAPGLSATSAAAAVQPDPWSRQSDPWAGYHGAYMSSGPKGFAPPPAGPARTSKPGGSEFVPGRVFVRGFAAFQKGPAHERWGFSKESGDDYWAVVSASLEPEFKTLVDNVYVGKKFRNTQILLFMVPNTPAKSVYALCKRLNSILLAHPPGPDLRGPGYKKLYAMAEQEEWKSVRNRLLRLAQQALEASGVPGDRIHVEHDGGEVWITHPQRAWLAIVNSRTECIDWSRPRLEGLQIDLSALQGIVEELRVSF